MTKTLFIFFMTISSCFSSYGQKDITDSLFSVRWNNFMCDSLFESFFTWDNPPICLNSFTDFTKKLNATVDINKKIHGEIEVAFFSNCKGEIDFIRFHPLKIRKKYYSILLQEGKLTPALFAKCGTWQPATLNGANVDAEHLLKLRFKKGTIFTVTDFYEESSYQRRGKISINKMDENRQFRKMAR